MVRIVGCESGYKHFSHGTTTLKSPTNDWGVMQINWPTWGKLSVEMGLDIKGSEDDNIKMGQYILSVSGEQAWVCSSLVS